MLQDVRGLKKVAKDLLIVQNIRLGGVAIMEERAIHVLFVGISIWKEDDFLKNAFLA
ncbi:MAG: hypothetical protein K9K79_03730 [Desulfohalobiaceae bacterium]|nr:hypothetical protein [Desulfohalobiaceae bacterium]